MDAVKVYNPDDDGMDSDEERKLLIDYYNYDETEVEQMSDYEVRQKIDMEEHYRAEEAAVDAYNLRYGY